jgi:hypothetical protein
MRKFSVRSGVSLGLVLAATATCVSPDIRIGESYATLQLINPLSMVRDSEPVLIPIAEIRSRFKQFDERDFSVHLLPSNWYPSRGDPLLATNPPPELPAQLIDDDLDGKQESLLVCCDFEAGENRFVAVASPRFTRFAKQIGPRVEGGLWMRETVRREAGSLSSEGKYIEVASAVLEPGHAAGDGLYQCDGIVFETDACAWRLLFDSRMCFDFIGKRERGIWLGAANPSFAAQPFDLAAARFGGSLLGAAVGDGGGAFGRAENGTIVPVAGFDSVQYRMIQDGPAATQCEVLLNGAWLGPDAVDLRWRITHYAGRNHLRHDVSASRAGHHLGFAMSADGVRKQSGSGQLGWMRVGSYGPSNVATGNGGALGLGLLTSGRTSNAFVKDPQDVIGVEFDPNARRMTFHSAAAWDQEPAGVRSEQDFQKALEDLAARLNTPIRISNTEKAVGN